MTSKPITIVTHSGSFHADDLFACAALSLLLQDKEVNIVRSRDMQVIEVADYVVDVGGVYDPERKRFDHHQKGRAGVRDNTIPYAAFGLVWNYCGLELCAGDQEVWERIEHKMVMPLDAIDNGVAIVQKSLDNLMPYFGDQPFLVFSPTWKEEQEKSGEHIDAIFREQVARAMPVLAREIQVAKDDVEGERLILAAPREGGVIIMDRAMPRYLYQNLLCKIPDVYFIVLPSETTGWKAEAIRKNELTMESRVPFPETWAGLEGEALQKVSGLAMIAFCHNGRFLIGAKTKEDVLAGVKLALEARSE